MMKTRRLQDVLFPLLICGLMVSACAPRIGVTEPPPAVPAADGLAGKVVVGYQGWYRTPGDGSDLGWEHYETYDEKFEPGHVGIDFWPDVSRLGEEEKFRTPFQHKDGSPAYVFSSQNEKTVDLHFQWMSEHGIDGAFLQRFAHDVLEGGHHQWRLLRKSNNRVLEFVQKGATNHGRAFAVMYDLSGIRLGEMPMVMDDWKQLCRQFGIRDDPNYLHENGKPLVAIWGVGFSDGTRKYTLDEVGAFIDFLKSDSEFGGCSVMLGVPSYWRSLDRDAVADPKLHDIIRKADVILPWSVGRFGGSDNAREWGKTVMTGDKAWCDANGVRYLPLAFPGFSWANRKAAENAKFNHIPREDGLFLWSQAVAAKSAGADSLYIAMFDEMDEGTQIFKVSSDPPIGASRFLTYEPRPPDFYLRLAGAIGRMLRNEIPAGPLLPAEFN